MNIAVLAHPKAAQVDGIKPPKPEIQSLAGQRQAKRAGKRLGKQGDDLGGKGTPNHARLFHKIASSVLA